MLFKVLAALIGSDKEEAWLMDDPWAMGMVGVFCVGGVMVITMAIREGKRHSRIISRLPSSVSLPHVSSLPDSAGEFLDDIPRTGDRKNE